MTGSNSPRPGDATLTVTKAARLLGVHPNTVRAWSEQGRLRYYRINERGDRRYRLADLQRFLTAAASGASAPAGGSPSASGTGAPEPGTALEAARSGTRRRRSPVPAWLAHAQTPPPDDVPEAVGPGAIDLLADLAELAASSVDLDQALVDTCRRTRAATGALLVGVWEHFPGGLVARAADGPGGPGSNGLGTLGTRQLPPGFGILGRALIERGPVRARPGGSQDQTVLGLGVDEIAVAIPGSDGPWGVLLLAGASTPGPDGGLRLARALARTLGTLLRGARTAEFAAGRLSRSEALRRVATDLASRLDLSDVLHDLVDHARVLFGADRVAVVLRDVAGPSGQPAASGFSAPYLALARDLEAGRDTSGVLPGRRPAVILGDGALVTDTPARAAAVGEGLHTLLVAPLADADGIVGMLHVGHERSQAWTRSDIEAVAALAGDAATAIRTARAFGRMATWAAQLQAIQSLGVRLSRLTRVEEIGEAIATELEQLIDFHNVRVYRIDGDELAPVAMRGRIGEYTDERPEQLRIGLGQGITGWVARHRVPQILADASADPRAMTIPGTEDDLPESMLLAPMVHEDLCLGVLVLSKLGLHQFTDDDLRLLVIYASFAAQAMANADATERLRSQSAALERRLRAQRELLRITESILTTLDPRAVLEQITERLGMLIACDNIAIEVVERPTGLLVPLTARGVHAERYLEPWEPGETGIATWVVDHNEPVLIADERTDPRVNHFRDLELQDGSLIVVPLIGPHGAAGVLTLERLGENARFDQDEFELVQLFAAQVSIALRNAETVHAVEVRARTDALTGLLNQGTFKDWLSRSVAAREPFSLVMIDLDQFKEVNDHLGHQAGDRLLREIADAIMGAARDTDAVFRYGGDEFIVILPRTEASGVLAVAERISASVRGVGGPGTIWHAEGREVSASVGLASFPVDGADAESILLAADRACFVAKRRGRGRVATAEEGLALAGEFTLSEPTPVDPPTPAAV
jgi:diguanylate cyclase (GGDEF)-like protein/excisionase family DNA binding protein